MPKQSSPVPPAIGIKREIEDKENENHIRVQARLWEVQME
jgi:hypothetical protein